MQLQSVITLTMLWAGISHASALAPRASLNGACTGAGGAPGVCISTSDCSSGGGSYISNACPGTPDNIKCCVKTSCSSGGNCRFTSQCGGTTLTGLCPGPADFKCCVPSSGGGSGGNLPHLNSVQTSHARVIISQVKSNGFASSVQKRACQVAIVTALQESSIRILANSNVPSSYNYPHDGVGSDHDSVGIFQQRPGWGSVKDRMDAAKSADKFLGALKGVSNWQNLSVGQAAQKVQVSAYPDAYAKWTSQATDICTSGW